MARSVTIRVDAANDLLAADLPVGESDDFVGAYRKAAELICDGTADVAVLDVTGGGGGGVGCDAEWAEEFGLWQAVHDCCKAAPSGWTVCQESVARTRRNLAVWMSRRAE